jgi:hypothetical protein
MKQYNILIHQKTFEKAKTYLNGLQSNKFTAGKHLKHKLKLEKKAISIITTDEFLEILINTKKPQIFAESELVGDGSDWNQYELSILGDISISVPVFVFDNGKHFQPDVYSVPIEATLIFVPGALLRNDKGQIPVDWIDICLNNQFNPDAYYGLYERRLFPPFLHANNLAKLKNKLAFITLPGIGCGQFAGKFRGKLGAELRNALVRFLNNYNNRFPYIRAVYLDTYSSCENERFEINHISFFVRPLKKGNETKPQLCQPCHYQEKGDDFSNCILFSLVAWDHVSWPGNDFYSGYRSTDDGVKAAATDSMKKISGIEGKYDVQNNTYDPPKEYRNWNELVLENKIHIIVKNNIFVLS